MSDSRAIEQAPLEQVAVATRMSKAQIDELRDELAHARIEFDIKLDGWRTPR